MEDILGRENICFSCVDGTESPENLEKWKNQRMTRGFDDTELWNLDITISKFIVSRLKAFKEVNNGFPSRYKSMEEWNKILDQMIEGFELAYDKFNWEVCDQNIVNGNQHKVEVALKLFQENFFDLWW